MSANNESESSPSQQRPKGRRGSITTRPSRDSIVRSYEAQDSARARNARMYSHEAAQSFQEREQRARERKVMSERLREEERIQAEQRRAQREQDFANARADSAHSQREAAARFAARARQPLTTQERHEQSQMSRKAYEQARATRDALSVEKRGRTTNREVIDGRGSIDSRAFNENNELIGYSINERDRPDPMVDASNPKTKWHSHAGAAFGGDDAARAFAKRGRRSDLGSLSDTISGGGSYGQGGFLSEVPGSIKFLVVLIVILVIVLLVILLT